MNGRVLVLGGTGEARRLAERLVAEGVDVLSSLAGRLADPRLPAGEVRIGGFGGPEGLAAALDGVAALVDATHPFAATMTAHAVAAAAATGTPLLRLQRPGWTAQPGDDWRWVDSLEAAAAAGAGYRSVFLTTGRQGLAAFAELTGRCLVRAVEPPSPPLPQRVTVVLARGPFPVEAELALMREHEVEVVVTKDSGGGMTAAKLTAARELGLPVVVVRRPPVPPGVPVVATVEAALAWLRAR
ncbi:cobalt-precorrin-6A reductase [Geodermatophilus sabuli]|uniref:Precorrin-6A/cobalt-precorrin-6A reductase n=1 Tax=Geodermatophilus sabuli TaxID=1564158 RepID=A0A285ECF3_9ACTN|nr:cobalt-precorrin-6A reductase [Geodermatophilus sabuli]MBB3083468.1 precorrin-6A/cobalt-precorrin-6A reductase [Geodermatophilus sabuli]SNX96812.1 precorrin-6A/cobalt-precorrin-6A reductase [Geodermatophilus sabuli]